MNAIDFCYDGQYLSDYGFIICSFSNNNGYQIVNEGSQLEFKKVYTYKGQINNFYESIYKETYTVTFDICKNPDTNSDIEISNDEFRDLIRWLNRKEFIEFCFIPLDSEETEKYYKGSFNVQKIIVKDKLYGLSLTLETDSTMGYGQIQNINLNVSDVNKTYIITHISDEIEYIYPNIQIEIMSNGTLEITNLTYNRTTIIKNCSAGETITIKEPFIYTSFESHDINNDWNYEFPRLENTIENRQNKFRFTLPCKVKISYRPLIK